jgi:hypothetical protein
MKTIKKFQSFKYFVTLLLNFQFSIFNSSAQQLAFPGAEGFGAYATGGRGGTVVHVTNLNATGEGSLMEAVSQPNRIVVFDVGGVIHLSPSQIIQLANNVTIAGQTAPGEGITIYGNRVVANGSNVIIRYIRMRGSINMSEDKCTFTCDGANNIILDHCTISWGRWDCVHITNSNNITWQNCIISEGIDPQRFGAITDGTRNWTITHCLWANNSSRNPKLKCYAQQINNVIYNYGNGIVGGHSSADNYQDVINNYFIAGPNTSSDKYWNDWTSTDHLYSVGNMKDENKNGKLDGVAVTDYNGATAMQYPHLSCPAPVGIESAEDAYNTIIASVGCSRVRDAHDIRLINQVMSLGTQGTIIHQESEVGGIGTVNGGTAPVDTDNDGMPDEWETANGLNPMANDANNDVDSNGYTNIEDYINSLAGQSNYLMYPLNVNVTLSDPSTAVLTWMQPEERATGIIVEQSEDGTVYTQIDSLAGMETTLTINGLTPKQLYYFRLKNTDGERYSLYSEIVRVNQPAGALPGGGTPKSTDIFAPKEGKLYRIVNYSSVAYNSAALNSGVAKYLLPVEASGVSVLGSTTDFEWDNPELLWEITYDEQDPTRFFIKHFKTGKYFYPISTTDLTGEPASASAAYLLTSDTQTASFAITFARNDKPSQAGINDSLSFYRINAPNGYQLRAVAFPNHWIWGSGTLDRADMIFTFVEIDASLVRLYTSGLTNTLIEANTLASNSSIGTGTLQYPEEAYQAFISVIETAQAFYNNIDKLTTEQETIDAQVAALKAAIAAFQATQIRTFGDYDPTKIYNIFSYGETSNASATSASSTTKRRYLVAIPNAASTQDSLVYKVGKSENEISAGTTDALITQDNAQWIITPGRDNTGYFSVKNKATNTYLQINNYLSENAVTIYPVYSKDDNGKHGYWLQISESNTRCFNVGAPDGDALGGPLAFAAPADRTRLRWIFSEAGKITAIKNIETCLGNLIFTEYYNLQGVKIGNPQMYGIYIVKRIYDSGKIQTVKIFHNK